MKEATKIQKFLQIEHEYVNGNLADFRKGLKSLNKLQLAAFILYANETGTIPTQDIIKHLEV